MKEGRKRNISCLVVSLTNDKLLICGNKMVSLAWKTEL